MGRGGERGNEALLRYLKGLRRYLRGLRSLRRGFDEDTSRVFAEDFVDARQSHLMDLKGKTAVSLEDSAMSDFSFSGKPLRN